MEFPNVQIKTHIRLVFHRSIELSQVRYRNDTLHFMQLLMRHSLLLQLPDCQKSRLLTQALEKEREREREGEQLTETVKGAANARQSVTLQAGSENEHVPSSAES